MKFLNIVLIALIAVSGCGEAPQIQIVPVQGVITIGGKPAANIMIQFMPDVAMNVPGITSVGVSDEQGRFRLTASDGREGAMPGTCQVVLADMDEERPAQGEPAGAPSRIPPKYATAGTGGLSVQVVDGQEVNLSIP
ncbi:MAG: hypothetical protein ACK526_04450 [Planctomyces sp.]